MTRTPASPSSITLLLVAMLVLAVMLSACGADEEAATVDDEASTAPTSPGVEAEASDQAAPDLPSEPEPAGPEPAGSGQAEPDPAASTAQVEGADRAQAMQNLVQGSAPVSDGIADCILEEVTDAQLAAVDNFSDEWRAQVAAADEPSAEDAAVIAIVQNCTGGVEATDG